MLRVLRLPTRFGSISRQSPYKRWRNVTAPPPPSPPEEEWIVTPVPVFIEDEESSYDIEATGPVDIGYLTGGVYDAIDGTPLPDGLTINDDGLLSGAAVDGGITTGVVFGYTEPGGFPTLSIVPNQTGDFPYLTGFYPAEGIVPAGYSVYSPDDPNLRASTISTWEDGSAQVMALYSRKTVTSGNQETIRVRPCLAPSETPLTAAVIAAKFSTGITVNLPPSGTSTTFNTWTSPEWVWWTNSRCICARYRFSAGLGLMEAIVDVHAFDTGHAFVEVVIENGKVNADQTNVRTGQPTTQTYTDGTVTINGVVCATVTTPTANMNLPNSRLSAQNASLDFDAAGHELGRSWYCSARIVGTTATAITTASQQLGPFGIEVIHDTEYLHAHPFFFKPIEASSENMTTKYDSLWDTAYVPWSVGRMRCPGMAAGGASPGSDQIGVFPMQEADYIVTGHIAAARASLVTGMGMFTTAIHIRHNDGRLPVRTQMQGKRADDTSSGRWPWTSTAPSYGGESAIQVHDGSHLPPVSLVQFLLRPSPSFIENAQKEFVWNCTNYASSTRPCGQHAYDQVRSRGWRLRNYAITAVLTPDSDYDGTLSTRGVLRKNEPRTGILVNIPIHDVFRDYPGNTAGFMWGEGSFLTGEIDDPDTSEGAIQQISKSFMNSYTVMCWTMIERMKVFRGADTALWTANCDWHVDWPIRHVNDAPGGEWHVLSYRTYCSVVSGGEFNMGDGNLAHLLENSYGPGCPFPEFSPWRVDASTYSSTEDDFDATGSTDHNKMSPSWTRIPYVRNTAPVWPTISHSTDAAVSGTFDYDAIWWAAFVSAVERGSPEADAAWNRVMAGVENFSLWRQAFRTYPKWNRWPRNKPYV